MVKEFDSRVFSLYIATKSVCKFYIPPKMASTAILIYIPLVFTAELYRLLTETSIGVILSLFPPHIYLSLFPFSYFLPWIVDPIKNAYLI